MKGNRAVNSRNVCDEGSHGMITSAGRRRRQRRRAYSLAGARTVVVGIATVTVIAKLPEFSAAPPSDRDLSYPLIENPLLDRHVRLPPPELFSDCGGIPSIGASLSSSSSSSIFDRETRKQLLYGGFDSFSHHHHRSNDDLWIRDPLSWIEDDFDDEVLMSSSIAPSPSSLTSSSIVPFQIQQSNSDDAGPFAPAGGKRDERITLKTTGTTIVGVLGRDYVVLACDTRATEGRIVADKYADKLHYLSPNLLACGAGTSADLEHVTKQVMFLSKLLTHEKRSIGNGDYDDEDGGDDFNNDDNNAEYICRWLQDYLYERRGDCGANLIVGGWSGDAVDGRPILRAIHPHGSMDTTMRFVGLGSGGYAATAILEQGYYPDMSLNDAVRLAQRAVYAGIQNDLGSGTQVDLCIIRRRRLQTRQEDEEGYRAIIETNITRASIPEEILAPHSSNYSKNDSTENGTGGSDTVGVNGFGNMPFAIRSVRTLVRISPEEGYGDDDDDENGTDRDDSESATRRRWDKILGF